MGNNAALWGCLLESWELMVTSKATQTRSEWDVPLQQSGNRFSANIVLARTRPFSLTHAQQMFHTNTWDANIHEHRTVQDSSKQNLAADWKFLEAIRGNSLVNQSNHSPRSPELFQIYFCLTFQSIFLSTCALLIMETHDYGTWSL